MTTTRPRTEVLVVLDPPERSTSPSRPGVSWTSVLDALEAHVDELEDALTGGDLDGLGATSAWPPPAGLGPMPREHLARARALQARQLRALDHLALAVGDVRGTLSFVSAATDHEPSRAFLDASL